MAPRKESSGTARWMVGLGAAILAGAVAGYALTSGGPEQPAPPVTDAPRVEAPREKPAGAAPRDSGVPAPAPPRADYVPAKPPPPRADMPFARARPGDEPDIPGDTKARYKEMQRRLEEWSALMAGTRADIRQQILEGKRQERGRLVKQLEEIDQALMLAPGDDEALEARRRTNEQLHYVEDAIQRLEELQESEP